MAEKLIGPKPIIGPGDSPDVIGGQAQTTEYAPINDAARRAILGTDPKTGMAYTDAESAKYGYNPYAGAVGYQIDPRTGNLNILKSDGTVLTTGATYKTTSQGAIVPSDTYMQNFNKRLVASGQAPIAYDEYGVQVTLNPDGTGFDSKGKPITVVYDAGGNPKGSPAAFIATNAATQSGKIQNPYVPGTEAFRAFGERESAYNLLRQQMAAYGLESLVDPLKNLVLEGVSPSEFTIRLRDTDAYKKRFAANQARINKGLRALSEAEYIGLEDQYQNVMRNYGLPTSYYTRGDMGRQEGFEKFIAGDVSATELEDRIQTAQNRVINAAPEVSTALKQFYPDITNGEILAYALDPNKAIEEIKRKVTAAEIGAGAMQAGLTTGATRAEELAKFGVTGQAARQGYQTIASFLPRASQLSDIYKQGPYTQTIAESEVFGTTGAVEAEKRRKQLTELETAQFSGKTGAIGTALGRERAGQF